LTLATNAVAEQTTSRITGTIVDDAGVAIPASALVTLTLTLYNRRGPTILNSRDNVSVLNTNGGTVDSAGKFAMTLDPADNPLSAGFSSEQHAALFTWTYNSGAATGRAVVEFTVS